MGADSLLLLKLSAADGMMGDVPVEHFSTLPLVGRDSELADLASLVGIGEDPSASAVLLAGDAGVGKTRLLTELRDRAVDAGWRVLVGHCLDFGDSALPYLPFSEILGRLTAESATLATAIGEAHPAVRHLQPGQRLLAGGGHADAVATERAELFEALHAAFEQLGAMSPLLVVVEDVHWADQSTRDLLSFLFTRRFSQPVSVVVSYRTDDLHRRHPLRAAAAQWGRLPGVHRSQLAPLSDASVRTLVHAIHPGPLAESTVHTIVERAEGNAFFAEELLVATELGGRGLPHELADLLLVRLDQLDAAARQTVRAASCAGRQVSHELLERVAGLAPETLEQGLRDAVESNVLVALGSSGYAFRHALLAEAVYHDLLPGERTRLHAAYVAALCSHEVGGTAAELARHARAAHDRVTAVRASVEAGDDAMSVGGPDEAARHYELALELLGDSSSRPAELADVDPVSLTGKASDAVMTAGHPFRALALVQDQLAQLPDDAPATDRARLLMNLAMAALLSDTSVNALEATTEALSLIPSEPSALRVKAMNAHARANSDRQRDDEAMRWATQALEMAERFGLSRVVADATTTIAELEERAGNPEESKRSLEKIVEQARADGDVGAELRALDQLGGMHFEVAHLEDAGRIYRAASARAAEQGLTWAPYGFDARLMAAITAYIAGDWDDAVRIVDVAGQAPPPLAEAALGAVGLAVAAGRGEADALELLPRVRAWWDKDIFISIASGGAAIDLYGDRGDIDGAVRVHDDVVESITRMVPSPSFLARIRLSALLLGQLAGRAAASGAAERPGMLERGQDLLNIADEARERAERRNGRIGPEGLAWNARVASEHLRLRWLSGIDSPAEEELLASWQATVAAFEEFGHDFELARSRTRLAAVLRSLGRAGEAREQADLARATAHRLRAEPLLTELRSLGAGTAGRRGEASRRDEALTPREHEILVLVAQGRSNSEIGRQLFISAKTVSVHVSNILAKLGASGRTEAAALARREGILSD